MAQLRYWIWLSSLQGLRPIAMRRVLEHFSDPMEAYYAPAEGFRAVPDLTEKEIALLDRRDLRRTEEIMEICRREDIRILTLQDAQYPERLRQIPDPPPVLYIRGALPLLDEIPAVAVVGTRKASAYGLRMARRLGEEISAGGGLVVTGLALGIDAAAAEGALRAQGSCVGVLGTAINVNYPAANAALIEEVAARGAVISEFPPLWPTLPENFPRRNRVISGLSCGTCVVEAPRRSGALITADLALEQGRDLFAVPGNADSFQSAGSNALLRDCAKAVTCGWDILEEYEGLYPDRVHPAKVPEKSPPEPQNSPSEEKTAVDKEQVISYSDLDRLISGFTADQQTLLRLLWKGDAQVDELIAATGFSPAKVLAELTMLTIRGGVKALPGKRYTLNLK